jgi:hypothetical protein
MEKTMIAATNQQDSVVSPLDLSRPTVFVYLTSGRMQEVSPATGVHVSGDEVEVMMGEVAVATFSRRDVYLCSQTPIAPPSLF